MELPNVSRPTRRNKFVPKMVNILVWPLFLNRIPTRKNLSLKGIGIASILCPICSNSVKTLDHAFGGCLQVGKIWDAIGRWVNVVFPSNKGPESIVEWLDSARWLKKKKDVVEEIVITTWWFIWRTRNEVIFGSVEGYRDLIIYSIVLVSFYGFHPVMLSYI
ncbi:uncharacterized protein LOC143629309 [Bidens hawaiensis]|uniref:uncharacterized protein LOC143629309 n=1 Tax=Bidens hawaiensis TaxID=980011 RepID=UPI0040495CBD